MFLFPEHFSVQKALELLGLIDGHNSDLDWQWWSHPGWKLPTITIGGKHQWGWGWQQWWWGPHSWAHWYPDKVQSAAVTWLQLALKHFKLLKAASQFMHHFIKCPSCEATEVHFTMPTMPFIVEKTLEEKTLTTRLKVNAALTAMRYVPGCWAWKWQLGLGQNCEWYADPSNPKSPSPALE